MRGAFPLSPPPNKTTKIYGEATSYFIFTLSTDTVTVHYVKLFYCFVSICFRACSKARNVTCYNSGFTLKEAETRNNRGF
jgi:hypothetical protein